MDSLRKLKHKELIKVAEVIDRTGWVAKTIQKSKQSGSLDSYRASFEGAGLTVDQYKTVLTGGLLTYLLHWLVYFYRH